MSESTCKTGDTTAHTAVRSGHSWLTWLCGTLLLPAAGLTVAQADTDHQRHLDGTSASCSAYIPEDARTVDSFGLCQSDHGGANTLYACLHFMSAKGQYRVLFSGGRHPEAIARLTTIGEVSELLWHKAKRSNQPTCDFPPPAQVPSGTIFIGAGVCEDEQAQSVPCAVFRDKSPQRATIADHMVQYRADGLGPHHTSIILIGVNEDAAPAQLAFQIGLELLKTSCCQQSGLKYVEHAYRLFPGSIVYRSAYQHYSQQALNGGPATPWPENNGESR
jgi:hypothetical protein